MASVRAFVDVGATCPSISALAAAGKGTRRVIAILSRRAAVTSVGTLVDVDTIWLISGVSSRARDELVFASE